MFNAPNLSAAQIINMVQQLLLKHRTGIEALVELHTYTAGISKSDLMTAPPDGPGMRDEDAQAILDAAADGWGEAQMYLGPESGGTGVVNGKYEDGYVLGAAQQRVIGPRSLL